MNNEEAQLILRAYRLGGQDASDPLVAEALEQARRDPELQKWFAAEQAIDLRVQTKLRKAVVTPADLKANLLALQRISRPASHWGRAMWLPAAAAIILLVGLAAVWFFPQNKNTAQLDSFRKAMVNYSMREHEHIVYEASDITKIQQWLQARGLKAEFDLPGGLRGKPAEGCRVVDWNGQKAALICYVLPGGNHVDIFVMDHNEFPGLSRSGEPQFAQAGSLMTVSWVKDNQVYLLTGGGDKRVLQKLLQPS